MKLETTVIINPSDYARIINLVNNGNISDSRMANAWLHAKKNSVEPVIRVLFLDETSMNIELTSDNKRYRIQQTLYGPDGKELATKLIDKLHEDSDEYEDDMEYDIGLVFVEKHNGNTYAVKIPFTSSTIKDKVYIEVNLQDNKNPNDTIDRIVIFEDSPNDECDYDTCDRYATQPVTIVTPNDVAKAVARELLDRHHGNMIKMGQFIKNILSVVIVREDPIHSFGNRLMLINNDKDYLDECKRLIREQVAESTGWN